MDIVNGATANLTSDSAKGIVQVIKLHVKYVIFYKKNADKFQEKLQMLEAKRASVQQQIEAAGRNVEKIKPDVELWCEKVDKVLDEVVKEMNELLDKASNKCCIGLCPNIKSRYQLSKKAEDDTITIDELVQECQFNGVSCRDVLEPIIPDSPSKDYKAFESREKVFNDIMVALKEASKDMIGVYGVGGVGKTMLVKEVVRQVLKTKLFDRVVVVSVTQNPDIEKIQDQIAEPLGLILKEKSTQARARRLCQRLKKEKKILVVLDDIWARLDLEEVGIPFGNQKGRKILVMSREQSVVSNEMDAEKTFQVCVLQDDEAFELFKKITGNIAETDELRPTAMGIARKCAGSPAVVVRVARKLRNNKQVFAWHDALTNKQMFAST